MSSLTLRRKTYKGVDDGNNDGGSIRSNYDKDHSNSGPPFTTTISSPSPPSSSFPPQTPLSSSLSSSPSAGIVSSAWKNLWSAKNASLIALVLQQSGLVLTIRYSRTDVGPEQIPYIPSVVVLSAEVLKFILNGSFEIMFNNPGGRSTADMLKTILASMITSESIKLFVPALLYLIQNNLLFVALKNLSVPVYQVLNQGKLFTTAFFSRLLLDKKISYCQYLSLLMMAMGVVIVQQSTNKDQSSSMNERNPWIGFLAVLFSSITSGFAAVYFEKLLKQKTDNSTKEELSVYIRNMSLAFWSIGLGTFPMFMTNNWNLVQQNGLFQGFTWIVLTIIVFQAITGLLVGFVMKYADSVLKGFATSVAVVLATILSIVFFNDSVNELFLVGASLVILAVRTYCTNNPSAGEGASDSSQPFYKKKLTVGVVARIVRVAVTALSCTGYFLYYHYYYSLPEDTATFAHDWCDVEGREVSLRVPPMFRNISVEVQKSALQLCKLEYMRSKEELLAKQKHINTTTCQSSVEVYAWLMGKVNSCGFDGKHALMIAYGELIHLLRDNAVLLPDGGYMDDDFDTWVTVPTLQMILHLEPYLWNHFGWSIRVYFGCDKSAIFAQIFPVCGHKYKTEMGKAEGGLHPPIELYAMKKIWREDKGWMLKDTWQGTSFPLSWLLPTRPYPLGVITPESSTMLNLQLPAQPEKILDCLYGDWHVFSSKHAARNLECKD